MILAFFPGPFKAPLCPPAEMNEHSFTKS